MISKKNEDKGIDAVTRNQYIEKSRLEKETVRAFSCKVRFSALKAQ
jgi:hypothetical protein